MSRSSSSAASSRSWAQMRLPTWSLTSLPRKMMRSFSSRLYTESSRLPDSASAVRACGGTCSSVMAGPSCESLIRPTLSGHRDGKPVYSGLFAHSAGSLVRRRGQAPCVGSGRSPARASAGTGGRRYPQNDRTHRGASVVIVTLVIVALVIVALVIVGVLRALAQRVEREHIAGGIGDLDAVHHELERLAAADVT